MTSKHLPSQTLHTSLLLTDLRWYYGPIAFFFGLIMDTSTAFDAPEALFIVLALYLLANFVIRLKLEGLRRQERHAGTPIEGKLLFLNIAQVLIDIAYFTFLILLTHQGFPNMDAVFYFIPIITTSMFFGFAASLVVAVLISIATVVILTSTTLPSVAGGFAGAIASPALLFPLTQAGLLTAIYVAVSIFAGSITRSFRDRGYALREKMKREEEHVRRLAELAEESNESAKLLVRRDLDLLKANRTLAKIDALKSEIISVVAHQLRTPLSAVKWTLKMLTDGDVGALTAEQKTLMLKAYESNERMIGLVNDMLSVDRMESGKFRYRFFPIQLEDLIENIVTEILPKANERQITLRFLRDTSALPKISIDPDKMRDAFQNLIDNAIKYSRPGSTVTIIITKDGTGSLTISVADQGIGIPAAEKGKIFSRFFRAQNALRVETDGSGLGLFIVRGIIQRHGGEIWFDSEEGKGTTFYVRLPLDRAEPLNA